tara:strand:+ start:114 stop:518 length:405 start_codon:yes stop_codon:yes gene_type:complete
MSRDSDKKYWDELSTQEKEDYLKKEEMEKEMDDYMFSTWKENYQMCDITYLENGHMVILEGARVNVLTDLYRALDDKFIFVITGRGSLGGDDEDRCVALNTNYIVSIDLKGYENVREIKRRNKLKFRNKRNNLF